MSVTTTPIAFDFDMQVLKRLYSPLKMTTKNNGHYMKLRLNSYYPLLVTECRCVCGVMQTHKTFALHPKCEIESPNCEPLSRKAFATQMQVSVGSVHSGTHMDLPGKMRTYC